MIAAGSLFTSCVENTEPQGIRDLREAKADYLASLSKLREADAEKVKAEATLVQAQAATEQARAALKQAQAKAVEIQNEYDAEHNAIELAKEQADAEVAIKKAEAKLVAAEQKLAEAEEALRKALVKIELEVNGLTQSEIDAISAYTRAYNKVLAKQADVKRAEAALYDATYNDYGEDEVEAKKADYEAKIVLYSALAVQNQALYDFYAEMKDEEVGRYEVWAAEYEKLKDSLTGYQYLAADINKEKGVYEVEHREAFNSFYATIEKQQKAVGDAYDKTTFNFNKEKFDLPTDDVDVIKTFKDQISNIRPKEVVSVVEDGKKLQVNGGKDAVKAAVYGTKDVTDSSLVSIIDALKRDSVVTDHLVKDTAGLGALVAKTQHDYDSIKAVLVAGVDAFEPIAEAKEAAKTKKEDYEAANKTFGEDTTALIKSIKDFVAALNVYNNSKTWKAADSEKVFNAFVAVMVAREKALEYTPEEGAADLNYFKYYDYSIKMSGATPVATPVLDSVKFSGLQFAGIKQGGLYAGRKNGSAFEFTTTPFQDILKAAFGCNFFDSLFGQTTYSEIKFADLIENTNYLEKSFYGKYWVSPYKETLGKIFTGNAVYVSKEVTDAKTAWDKAEGNISTAEASFYTNIYEKFWGVKFTTSADSLKINYTEKTYTDPTVLPVFKFKAESFKAAEGKKAAEFNWANIDYNSDNNELVIIKNQLGQNNIKIEKEGATYTLYAKTLAAAQFEKTAKTWKENTKALGELSAVVDKVKAAFEAKEASVAAAQTAADSIVTAVLGEDVVKAALKKTEKKHATDLWSTYKSDYFVNYSTRNIDPKFIDGGKFKLGGQQLAAAEAYISDYAAKNKEWATKTTAMTIAIKNCNDLATIIGDYVKAIQAIEEYPAGTDPIDQVKKVKGYYNTVLEQIDDLISEYEETVALAEGILAKIEAGYDLTQVEIEHAADMLAQAQAALEAAEAELAAAEAAYKQVLANHGITE